MLLLATAANAQNLSYDNHRKVQIPEYAVLRIGPFYSNLAFTQSVGYRWTQSRGTGTDFTFANRRGTILDDGSEFPLISTLDMRNYVPLTEHTDLDLSIRVRFEHYPLETQEDDFYVTLPQEGIDGNLSSTFQLTPYVRGTWADNFVYRTDYVDTRGLEDIFGGQRYEYFRNVASLRLDWLMAKNQNMGLTVSRRDEVPLEDEFEQQEAVHYKETLSYGYQLLPGVVVGASANYAQIEYADTNRADATIEDYSIYLAGSKSAGDQVALTEVTTLRLALGVSGGYSVSQSRGSVTNQSYNDFYEGDQDSMSGMAELTTRLRKDLSHTISYQRGISGSFSSAFQENETYGYRIGWQGDIARVSLSTRLNRVLPSSSLYTEYEDWVTSLNATYQLTRRVALNGSSIYTVRDNQSLQISPVATASGLTAVQLVEQSNDYDTWVTRIGTGVGVTKKIRFNTSVQHAERRSDSDDLEYERDTFTATFTYRHQF